MAATVKQRNFRLDDETVEKFTKLCEELGFTQAQGFSHIVEIAELEKAKSILSNRETEIDDFQQKVKSLVTAYLYSLELNENSEARIRETFLAALESKDAVILNLQQHNQDLESQLEAVTQMLEQQQLIESELESARNDSIKLKEKYEEDLLEKTRLNDLLSDKISSLSKELKNYEELQDRYSALLNTNDELRTSLWEQEVSSKEALNELNNTLNDTIRNLEQELKDVQKENVLIAERVKMDLEKKHSEELREIDNKHNATMMELMVQVQDYHEEKAKLAIELAQLQNASAIRDNKRIR